MKRNAKQPARYYHTCELRITALLHLD